MFKFYLYETANIPLLLKYKDDDSSPLEDLLHIVVSIGQYGKEPIDLEDDELGLDVEAGRVNVHLTQEQTGSFEEGFADIQVNLYYTDKERDTSVKGRIEVEDNLYKKVMS